MTLRSADFESAVSTISPLRHTWRTNYVTPQCSSSLPIHLTLHSSGTLQCCSRTEIGILPSLALSVNIELPPSLSKETALSLSKGDEKKVISRVALSVE
jgi:hypothetical protein